MHLLILRKIGPRMSAYPNARAKIKKKRLSVFRSKEIGSRLVSFSMIFEALQSELFRFKFHSVSSKILKTQEINLYMSNIFISFWDIFGMYPSPRFSYLIVYDHVSEFEKSRPTWIQIAGIFDKKLIFCSHRNYLTLTKKILKLLHFKILAIKT